MLTLAPTKKLIRNILPKQMFRLIGVAEVNTGHKQPLKGEPLNSEVDSIASDEESWRDKINPQ